MEHREVGLEWGRPARGGAECNRQIGRQPLFGSRWVNLEENEFKE